jgi:hypothetical protein
VAPRIVGRLGDNDRHDNGHNGGGRGHLGRGTRAKMTDLPPEPGQEAARRISELLARPPADPAALMAVLGPMQILEEAELAVRGIHPVSVVHGAVASADDEALVFCVLPQLAREAGSFTSMRGGIDYMTWFFGGPEAEQAASAFISRVTTIAPHWWVVTTAAQPRFYR